MPKQERFKTDYAGVFYIKGKRAGDRTGARSTERIYYIVYRRHGKLVEEKAGRQFQDDMTPSRAAGIRATRIEGNQLSNSDRRASEKAAKEAETNKWTLTKLWETYRASRPDSKSLRTDRGRFTLHLAPTLGTKEPHVIAPLDVDRLRVRLSKTLAPQTVKHVLALLKRIVQYGVDKNLCLGLAFKVKLPMVDNVRTEFLDDSQVDNVLRILEEWPDRQTADMMLLALLTGLRRGELYKLQWQDVDFQRGFIYITRNPKGGKSQHIPIGESAADLLRRHPRISSDFVFSHSNGNPFTDASNHYHQLKDLRSKLSLPDGFRPLHGFRHQFASMLAGSGQVDMYTLSKLLTHKSPMMTQRYAHLRDEALRKASDLAGQIIDEVGKGKEVEVADG
jgi:integrase